MRRNRWLLLGFVLLFAPCVTLVPSVFPRYRGSERWCETAVSLGEIARAMAIHEEAFGHLPPAVVRDQDGRPLYSWRVLLLPLLEADLLGFRTDEPWDSPHNRQFLGRTPRGLRPDLGRDAPDGMTRYLAVVGPGTAFERPGMTLADLTDGAANTALVVEAGEPVPWSKPAEFAYDPCGPLPALGSGLTRPVKLFGFEVGRRGGFLAGFADGKARFVPDRVGEPFVRGLLTRNGGEGVDVSRLD